MDYWISFLVYYGDEISLSIMASPFQWKCEVLFNAAFCLDNVSAPHPNNKQH